MKRGYCHTKRHRAKGFNCIVAAQGFHSPWKCPSSAKSWEGKVEKKGTEQSSSEPKTWESGLLCKTTSTILINRNALGAKVWLIARVCRLQLPSSIYSEDLPIPSFSAHCCPDIWRSLRVLVSAKASCRSKDGGLRLNLDGWDRKNRVFCRSRSSPSYLSATAICLYLPCRREELQETSKRRGTFVSRSR